MLFDNMKKGLRELLKAMGSAPKDASGSQPSLPPPLSVNSFAPTNLKKWKKEKEVVEEGELVPQKEEFPPKHRTTAKGKGRTSSVKSKDNRSMVDVHL